MWFKSELRFNQLDLWQQRILGYMGPQKDSFTASIAFSTALLEQFWNLTKSDYKLEIFKILNDCEYSLE